jgi:hypothetical protein
VPAFEFLVDVPLARPSQAIGPAAEDDQYEIFVRGVLSEPGGWTLMAQSLRISALGRYFGQVTPLCGLEVLASMRILLITTLPAEAAKCRVNPV